jgi:hypothetical protein
MAKERKSYHVRVLALAGHFCWHGLPHATPNAFVSVELTSPFLECFASRCWKVFPGLVSAMLVFWVRSESLRNLPVHLRPRDSTG